MDDQNELRERLTQALQSEYALWDVCAILREAFLAIDDLDVSMTIDESKKNAIVKVRTLTPHEKYQKQLAAEMAATNDPKVFGEWVREQNRSWPVMPKHLHSDPSWTQALADHLDVDEAPS